MDYQKITVIYLTLLELLAHSSVSGQENCITDCWGLDDGYYSDCAHCDWYIQCFAGKTYNRPCAIGTKWSRQYRACVHKHINDACGNPREDNPKDVTTTSRTNPTLRTSPSSKTISISKTSPVTSSRASTTNATSTTSLTSLSSTTSAPNSNFCVRECPADLVGVFADCGDCHVFHMCTAGQMMNFSCAEGKLFDSNDKRCVDAALAECGYNLQTKMKTYDGCENSCEDKEDGFYAHCTDYDKFVLCTNRNVAIYPCPSGHRFRLQPLACLADCKGGDCA